MRIRIHDIPQTGRTVAFELQPQSLNARIAAAEEQGQSQDTVPCVFLDGVQADLQLRLEGSTVLISGQARGRYRSLCGRCAEDCEQELHIRVDMILQPKGEREAVDEDVAFGFYEEKEVDCTPIVEELLILALPYRVLCSEECRGLCPDCGQNLNVGDCACAMEEPVDPRFAALKGLKLPQ